MKKVLLLLLLPVFSFSQIKVIQFNASWNKANDVSWVQSLKDCNTISYTDVAKDVNAQKK